MQLYLIRHPRPRVAPGTCYGRLDLELAEPAGQAATRIAPRLPAGLPLWTSPARRCRELAAALHPAPAIEPRLWEMDFGLWEGKSWDEIGPAALDSWAADPAGFVPPGGESGLQVQARALDFVRELAQTGIIAAAVLTHAGILRALLAHQLQWPGQRWLELRFDYEQIVPLHFNRP
ncbi:histidine phosphatase family protein [Azovibrio restrictus]|uniref:histidine phosphatase family protein n=1 Tax=Azovibrio restrictus TaxID=146938 RepID=UPI0026F30C1A|nr:histidine phosphatase family protein [Azovibrio restrictus]MDD3483750.1 histidine phosphatase family protein [Azovibrio restrictus]